MKFWNGMTLEEAHRKMWNWLSENPTKLKSDWLRLNNVREEPLPKCHCFACESCEGLCNECHIKWSINKTCLREDSPYYEYSHAYLVGDSIKVSKMAKIIAEKEWSKE